jgi:formate dehydrogenase major subunit
MPFIMNPEGVSRLFARGMLRDGPFPVHYEPFESPVATSSRRNSGAIRWRACSRATWKQFGTPRISRSSATTYRLTEHFHLLDQARVQ